MNKFILKGVVRYSFWAEINFIEEDYMFECGKEI